jgi:hypothetical protein
MYLRIPGVPRSARFTTAVIACSIGLVLASAVRAQQAPHQYIARVVPQEPGHSPKLLFSNIADELPDVDLMHNVDHGLLVVRSSLLLTRAAMAALMEGTGYLLLHFQADPRDPWDVVKSGAFAPVPVYTETGDHRGDTDRYTAEIAAWMAEHPMSGE